MGLEKTHYNDAIIISGIQTISENPDEWLLIRQFRKKKRSLHEGIPRKGRKEPNRTQKRNSKNTLGTLLCQINLTSKLEF